MTKHKCCKPWEDAKERGTDIEGYGVLLNEISADRWFIGIDGDIVKFCPWCGAKVGSDDAELAKIAATPERDDRAMAGRHDMVQKG